jgi:hypothetical protein
MKLDEWKAKLKAYFASQLWEEGDMYGPPYSEVTGGDLEGFSLEKVNKVIDKFDPGKITGAK